MERATSTVRKYTGFKPSAGLSFRSSSLWVYVFDDSDEQIPPPYLAKAPIPLSDLATGREVKGEGRSTHDHIASILTKLESKSS